MKILNTRERWSPVTQNACEGLWLTVGLPNVERFRFCVYCVFV